MISAEGLGYTFMANDLASGPITRLSGNVKGLAATSTAAQATYNRNIGLIKAGTKSLMIGGIGLLAINSLTKSYGKFEIQLASAGAVMNATAGEMEALEKAAIGAGIATQFDPAQAAQGLESLGAAGMDAKTAIATLNPVLNLAAASLGQLGVAESAAVAASVLNAFGDSADFAAKRVDQLVKIAQTTAFQPRDFAIALSQASAQAKAANQTFESMTATLGMLRNVGLDASSAATGYREALRRLAGDKRALKELDKLSISTLDKETGKIKDLGRIMKELIPKMESLGAQEKNLVLKRILGVRGMKTYSAFFQSYKKAVKEGKAEVGDYAAVHEKLVLGLDNAGGAAKRTADRLLATAEGQRILMKGSVETLKVVAGKALVPAALPALKAMITTLNALIKVVNLIPAPMRGFLSHFIGVGAAMLAFSGIIKIIVGARGLMALSSGMNVATVATTRLTIAQARQNIVMARGQGMRAMMGARVGLMTASISSSLPVIGIAIAAVMGYVSMLDERDKKEKKRLAELKENQRRMRAQYRQTASAVDSIGRAAARTGGKLIKLSRTKELLQSQDIILKNIKKAEAAESKFLQNSINLHTGNLSKKKKAEALALNLKLKKEMDSARKIVEVYKHVELQVKANIMRRIPVRRRTELQNRTIVASSQAKILEMGRVEDKLATRIATAKKHGRKETAKDLEKQLAATQKRRKSETMRAARLAGFKGKDQTGAERAIDIYAKPVMGKVKRFGKAQKPPGMDQAQWEALLRDPGAIGGGGGAGLMSGKQKQFIEEQNIRIGGLRALTGGRTTVTDPTTPARAPDAFSTMGEEDIQTGLQATIVRQLTEAINRARINVSLNGDELNTKNSNRESRTSQGKPAAPSDA